MGKYHLVGLKSRRACLDFLAESCNGKMVIQQGLVHLLVFQDFMALPTKGHSMNNIVSRGREEVPIRVHPYITSDWQFLIKFSTEFIV